MKLAEDRAIKARGYFAANDQAATMAKLEAKVQAAFKKAGNLAKAKSALAAGAKTAHALRNKIHLGVIGKFDAAVTAVGVAKKKAAASAKVFARLTIAAAAEQAAANRAAGPMKKDILGLTAARKHRVRAAATLKSSGALLKKAKNAADAAKAAYTKAALARAGASKAHAASFDASRAAILRKAAAHAAAIAAHKAVRKHAMEGWMYL